MSVRVANTLFLSLAIASCSDKPSSSPSVGAQNAAGPAAAPTGTLAITGTLGAAQLSPDVTGGEPQKLTAGQEVEIIAASGAQIGKATTASDGSFAVSVPGALAIPSGTSLTAGTGPKIRTVAVNTANRSVVGLDDSLDLTKAALGSLALGVASLRKITAIRGRATLEASRDQTGVSVYVPGTSFAARTNSSGDFVMTFIEPGTYDLQFEKDGYVAKSVSGVTVVADETSLVQDVSLALAGGVANFRVKQVGGDGYASTRAVDFEIDRGTADRMKIGLASDVDGMTYGAPAGSYRHTFPADGTYTLKFMFATADGFESLLVKTITIDTALPSADNAWLVDRTSLSHTLSNETLLLPFHSSCDDIESFAVTAVDAEKPSLTQFTWACPRTLADATLFYSMPTGASSFAYKIWAKDRAGNVSAAGHTGSISLDISKPTAPTFTMTNSDTASTTITASQTVAIAISSCADVDKILIGDTFGAAPAETAAFVACSTTPFTLTFSSSDVGAKAVYLWARDTAGNISETSTSRTMIFDNRLPGIPAFYVTDATSGSSIYTNSTTVNVTVSSCSNIDKILIGENLTTAPAVSAFVATCSTAVNAFTYTLSTATQGARNITMWSRSPAGVVSLTPENVAINLTTTPPGVPSVSYFDQDSLSTTYTNDRLVKATISDCTGIRAVLLSFAQAATPDENQISSNCTTASGNYTVNMAPSESEGTKTLYIWVRDDAGNIAGGSVGTMVYDSTPPSVPSFTLRDQSSASTSGTDITTVNVTVASCTGIARVAVGESLTTRPSAAIFSQACSTANNSFTYTFGTNVAETKTAFLWAVDEAGNVTTTSTSAAIVLDRTAPTAPSFTLADPTPVCGGGCSNSMTINVTPANCTDITHLYVAESAASTPAENDSAWRACGTSAGSVTALALGEGSRTFYLWARDIGGNISAVSTQASITIDTSAPSFSLADPTPSTAGYSNTTSITATPSHCNDITHVMVSESQASAPDYNAASGWVACSISGVSATAAGSGARSLYLWAKYAGGYVSANSSTASITVDLTPPTAPSITLSDVTNSDTAYTNGQTLNVAMTCGDSAKVYLSETNSAPSEASVSTTCAASLSFSLANLSEGTKTVYLWGKDSAGNVSTSPASASIVADTTAPSLPATFSAADSTSTLTTYSNSQSITYALATCPTDNGQSTTMHISNSSSSAPLESDANWETCSTSGIKTALSNSQGSQTVYLWLKDRAGNVSTSARTHSITYDTFAPSAPTITIEDTDGLSDSGYTNSLNAKATLSTCTDIYKVLINASASTPSEGSIANNCSTGSKAFDVTFTGSDGTKTGYVWVKDEAGNIASASSSIVYDLTQTTITSFRVSALTSSSVTLDYTSDENIKTRLDIATSSNGYSAPDDIIRANNTTSHNDYFTSLTANTLYYITARALDHAENVGTHPELSVRPPRLTKITHPTDNSTMGMYTAYTSGQRVMTVCDVNGDGKKDLIVAIPTATYSARANAWIVYVKYGTASPASSYDITATADVSFGGGSASQYLGRSVACGQFTGSSEADLILGTAGSSIYVIAGAALSGDKDLNSAPNYTLLINLGSTQYGLNAGDLNGDGYAEVVACHSSGCTGYHGGASANTASDFSTAVPTPASAYGTSLQMIDIDNDTYGDLIVGDGVTNNYDASVSSGGGVHIYRGASSYTGARSINTSIWGSVASAYQGVVSPAGDLDGDGYNDFIVRTRDYSARLYIVWGRSTAEWDALTSNRLILNSSTSLYISQRHEGGSAASSQPADHWYVNERTAAAELSGDSKSDLLFGMPGTDTSSPKSRAGMACLFLGRTRAQWEALASSGQILSTSADFCFLGATVNDYFGYTVAIGDVMGGAGSDLVISAPSGDGAADAGTNRGEISIIEFSVPSAYGTYNKIDISENWP